MAQVYLVEDFARITAALGSGHKALDNRSEAGYQDLRPLIQQDVNGRDTSDQSAGAILTTAWLHIPRTGVPCHLFLAPLVEPMSWRACPSQPLRSTTLARMPKEWGLLTSLFPLLPPPDGQQVLVRPRLGTF